jgi:hypothetical protein
MNLGISPCIGLCMGVWMILCRILCRILWMTADSGKTRNEGESRSLTILGRAAMAGFRLGLAFIGYLLQHGIPIFTRQPLSALH